MVVEELQRMWDRDTFMNPEARKRAEAELKRKKRAEKEKKKKQKIEEDIAKEKEWARQNAEIKEKLRQEYASIPDLPRRQVDLNDVIMVNYLNMEIPEELPGIIDWSVEKFTIPVKCERLRVERADGSLSFWRSVVELFKVIPRVDLVRLYEIGTEKNLNSKKFESIMEMGTWNNISMMFEPEKFVFQFNTFKQVKKWNYLINSRIHQVIMEDGTMLWMLTEREYEMNLSLLRSLKNARLYAPLNNDAAENLVYMILNQIHKKEEYQRRQKQNQ